MKRLRQDGLNAVALAEQAGSAWVPGSGFWVPERVPCIQGFLIFGIFEPLVPTKCLLHSSACFFLLVKVKDADFWHRKKR